jgi:hypothetical protein
MKLTREVKRELRRINLTDSDSLFNAAWRDIIMFSGSSEIDDLDALYDSIVSEMVNDSNSRFYIYG